MRLPTPFASSNCSLAGISPSLRTHRTGVRAGGRCFDFFVFMVAVCNDSAKVEKFAELGIIRGLALALTTVVKRDAKI